MNTWSSVRAVRVENHLRKLRALVRSVALLSHEVTRQNLAAWFRLFSKLGSVAILLLLVKSFASAFISCFSAFSTPPYIQVFPLLCAALPTAACARLSLILHQQSVSGVYGLGLINGFCFTCLAKSARPSGASWRFPNLTCFEIDYLFGIIRSCHLEL